MGFKQIHASKVTTSDTTRLEELGLRRVDSKGKVYQYVVAATALVQGYVVGGLSTSAAANYRVSPDISKTNGAHGFCVGIALASVSAEHFGYIQKEGHNAHTKTGGSVVAGNALVWSADMLCRAMAATLEHLVFGRQGGQDDSGSISTNCRLNCFGL